MGILFLFRDEYVVPAPTTPQSFIEPLLSEVTGHWCPGNTLATVRSLRDVELLTWR